MLCSSFLEWSLFNFASDLPIFLNWKVLLIICQLSSKLCFFALCNDLCQTMHYVIFPVSGFQYSINILWNVCLVNPLTQFIFTFVSLQETHFEFLFLLEIKSLFWIILWKENENSVGCFQHLNPRNQLNRNRYLWSVSSVQGNRQKKLQT